MPNRDQFAHGEFCWVDAMVHNRVQAESFYGKLFDWSCRDAGGVEDEEDHPDHPYGFFHRDGRLVAGIGEMSEEMKTSGMPSMWNSYLAVDDLDPVLERATGLGGRIVFPAQEVPGSGRLAFIQDPTGAMVGLWQAKGHVGSQTVNEPGSFCWNELATRDTAAAREFYAALLGWEYRLNDQSPSEYHVIKNDCRENGGIMRMDEQWGETPAHWTVYFAVADIAKAIATLKDAGGKLFHGPFETPVGPIAVVADPQGAMFHLIELHRPME